ncbi:MAG: hypothetical protein JWM68_1515 [Verrucomicrobiales bacterium]|nr:hypothetical protein [Verrucomicrobiales bacterium]
MLTLTAKLSKFVKNGQLGRRPERRKSFLLTWDAVRNEENGFPCFRRRRKPQESFFSVWDAVPNGGKTFSAFATPSGGGKNFRTVSSDVPSQQKTFSVPAAASETKKMGLLPPSNEKSSPFCAKSDIATMKSETFWHTLTRWIGENAIIYMRAVKVICKSNRTFFPEELGFQPPQSMNFRI